MKGGGLGRVQVQVRHECQRPPAVRRGEHWRMGHDSERHGFGDDHVFFRHVLVETAAACGHFADGIDHLGTLDYLAEHGVAPTAARGRCVVQETVVGHVDEELSRGRVRVVGAGHRQGVVVVLQAVVGFVVDGGIGALLLHAGFEPAALDHEAVHHAVKNGVVIVALGHIRQEVGG